MRPLPDWVLSFTPIGDTLATKKNDGYFFVVGVHAVRLTQSQPMHEKTHPLPARKFTWQCKQITAAISRLA